LWVGEEENPAQSIRNLNKEAVLARPNKPRITRDMATRAALDIIDREGLENFSLTMVSRAMGVNSPSLYHHFRDKSELLAEIPRHILRTLNFKPGPGDNWEERTLCLCIEARRGLLQHPHAAPLILQFFPRHSLLTAYEQAMKDYPERSGSKLGILDGIEKLTFGSALFEAASIARGIPSMPTVDGDRFPNLARAITIESTDSEATFIAAMRMFLAGVRSTAFGG
jgi:TetR/AcrR family tetracycline transcriptional repressor